MTTDNALPKVFGRYLLLRRLCRGGMGEIFLAKSGQLSGFEKLCVIKKIVPGLAEDVDFIRRFVDEAKVAVKLSHANIASVYEVGRTEGEYFLALDYVDGRDLRRILGRLHERHQRMPIDLALLIVREVANGLAYAHRRTDERGEPLNLVHCDISPPNVIVSFEGEVKIIDFGIAKSALRVSVTNPHIGFGKLGYMAPEQLLRGGQVDRRTDVYATGVLLHEVLTGERLIDTDALEPRAIARIVAQGNHRRPSESDPALKPFEPIVARALSPDPAARYATAAELRDAVLLALARINPTLTADRLGAWLRTLFADEVAEERAWLRQASQTSLADWAEELDGAGTHTVTFGLHEGLTALIPGDGGSTRPEAGESTPPAQAQVATTAPALAAPARDPAAAAAPRRRWTGLAVGGTFFAVGAGLALLLAGGRFRAPPATASKTSAPTGAPPIIVQPLITGPPIVVERAAPDASPAPADAAASPVDAGARAPGTTHPRRPRHPDASSAARPAEGPTAAQVEAKLRAVRREYATFKAEFGARLEPEWGDLLNYATYGAGEDKHRQLDVRLDALRRHMGEIRAAEK